MACAACPRVRASPREFTPVRASPRFGSPSAVRAGPRPVRVFRESEIPAGTLQSAPRGIYGGLESTVGYRYVSRGVSPRLFISACGMRRGDVVRDLLRSGSCRECGLGARHLVQVLLVLIIVHSE